MLHCTTNQVKSHADKHPEYLHVSVFSLYVYILLAILTKVQS